MIGAVTDGAAAAERQLNRLRHDPGAIALTLGAPVVLVILFGYILGSAISVPGGGNYREFLLPGLFATTAANILPSMIAMARDSTRGVVDRFRSLPIARTAVPFGQAAASTLYGLGSFVLMGLCGLAVGWRIERGAGYALAAAMRDLFGNPAAPANGTWPLLHPVLASVGWLVLLLAIFVPLCAARYARA